MSRPLRNVARVRRGVSALILAVFVVTSGDRLLPLVTGLGDRLAPLPRADARQLPADAEPAQVGQVVDGDTFRTELGETVRVVAGP